MIGAGALSQENVILLAMVGVVIFFAGFIVFLVRLQTRQEKALLDTKPSAFLQGRVGHGFKPEDALVASLQTNWKNAQLILKDYWGRDVGVVTYESGAISMTIQGNHYTIDNIKRPYLQASFCTREGTRISKSTANRLKHTSTDYDIPGFGRLTVTADLRSMFKSDYTIIHDGQPIGRFFSTRKFTKGHLALLLKSAPALDSTPLDPMQLDSLPVEARAFIMAMEYRRLN